MSNSPMIPMFSPDGVLGYVPVKRLKDATAAGGKVAIKMQAPNGGDIGYVPADKANDAAKAGGKSLPYDSEDFGDMGKITWQGTKKEVGNTLAGQVSGLNPFTKENLIGTAVDPTGAMRGTRNAINEAVMGWQRGKSAPGKLWEAISSAAASPFVSAQTQAEHAEKGESNKILAETAVPAVETALLYGASKGAPKAVGKVADIASNARESIGKSIHVPETGELTPGASTASRGAGAAVGGAVGGGAGSLFGPGGTYAGAGIGATSGAILGPSLMERMFPEPAESIAARNTFKTTQEITEAHEAALKEAQTRANTERIEKTRALRDEQKSRDELWQARDQYAQDLVNRQSAQDKLDAAEVRTANAAARAKKEGASGQEILQRAAEKAAKDAENSRNQHAQDLMNRQKQQDVLDANHAKALKNLEDIRQKELADMARFRRMTEPEGTSPPEEQKPLQGNPTPFNNPQDLLSRTKKLVKPGEAPSAEDLKRAGDMTQVPLPKLKLLASWGDELAKNEINRRVRNQ